MGISSEEFWALTPREYQALSDIRQQALDRWALPIALYANVHQMKYQDGRAITFNTLTGRHEKPKVQSISEMRAVMQNFRNPKAIQEWVRDDVPEWAKKG